MLSHTGEKPFICKQCNYLFVYLHIRHPGTSFLRSSYNYIFKNIAYVIVYVWPSRTWDEILLPFQKGLFFPLGDIRLFLPTRIRICAYAHHPTWIRHGRIRMAIPSTKSTSNRWGGRFNGDRSSPPPTRTPGRITRAASETHLQKGDAVMRDERPLCWPCGLLHNSKATWKSGAKVPQKEGDPKRDWASLQHSRTSNKQHNQHGSPRGRINIKQFHFALR